MGGCLSNQKVQQEQIISEISIESQFTSSMELKIISISYFYHLLRKEIYLKLKESISKAEIINLTEDTSLILALRINIDSISKSLKLIYDHKPLIVIDTKTTQKSLSPKLLTLLQKFIEVGIKPSKVLVVNRIKQFSREYHFFSSEDIQNSIFNRYNIPLLTLDSKDIQREIKPFQIYIHSKALFDKNKGMNPKFYEEYFQIKQSAIINFDQAKSINLQKILQSQSKLLILHHTNQQISDISKQIIQQMSTNRRINKYNLSNYLSLRLPITTQNPQLEEVMSPVRTGKAKTHIVFPQTKQAELERLFLNYYQQSKSLPLTDEIFKLLTRLLENITKQEKNQIWRSIKPTKAQYSEKLLKYKSGYDLIEAIGFFKKGDVYYNGLESKYLKLFKTDLPLAYRQMTQSIK